MPNWCENQLRIRGKGVSACLEAIEGKPDEDGPCLIDFQRIVPMPAILKGTVSSPPVAGFVLLGDDVLGQQMLLEPWAREKGIIDLDALRSYLREEFPDAEEQARRSLQAEQETGCRDWYEWCVGKPEKGFEDGHWGTKWNATFFRAMNGVTDTRATISFTTAWSPPIPVIIELSRKFPELRFALKYWEGGMGFCGILRAQAGIVLDDRTFSYSGLKGG